MASQMVEVREASELRFEQHRVELTGYCYRMLGSAFEAEVPTVLPAASRT